MNAYGYIVRNGCYEDSLNTSHPFIIFADTEEDADEWVNEFVKNEVKNEKYETDDGEIINWWWKYYSIEKPSIPELDNTAVNVRYIAKD